ncbi:MAG: hypothetical protein MI922_19060 [Bacteroidales bacterium]|nr:hypothetical protein [Bacteroidales bacterium]
MKNVFFLAVILLFVFVSCEKETDIQTLETENSNVKDQEILSKLEAKHQRLAEDFMQREEGWNNPSKEYLAAEQAWYSKNPEGSTTELKAAPAVAFALSWWVGETASWLYGMGMDKASESIIGDAAESVEDYTEVIDKIVNKVKTKDADALMIAAKKYAMRDEYLKCADKMEDALANYLSILPQSAAHLYPCLKAIENAYVQASKKDEYHFNENNLRKYSTWAYNNYRLVYEELMKQDSDEVEKIIKQAGGVYFGNTGLYTILQMSTGFWYPQKKTKYRKLPWATPRAQFDIEQTGWETRMHQGALVMESRYFDKSDDKRLSYCRIKRNEKYQYQFVWKDDKNKDVGLCYLKHKINFGKNDNKNWNWVEMKRDKAGSYLWTLIPSGSSGFYLIHKEGKVVGGTYKGRVHLNNAMGKTNKPMYLYIADGTGYIN